MTAAVHDAPTAARIRYCQLRDAWHLMTPGDLLLYRADNSLEDLAIAEVGRGPWCHSAMLDWVPPSLSCDPCRCGWRILEVIQRKGFQDTPLSASVREHPGHWDVFGVDPEHRWPHFDRALAVARMRDFKGCRYGRWHLIRLALGRLPVIGRWLAPSIDDAPHEGCPPFCSEATSTAYQAGGVDDVPNLAARYTEPADQARSLFFQYRFTLIP